MHNKKIDDDGFIDLWNRLKSPTRLAKELNVDVRAVMSRRRRLENKYKIELRSESVYGTSKQHLSVSHIHKARIELGLLNGVVLVFSDAHFWPGIRSTAFKGLLWAISTLKPKAIICNGDAFDGASISRYPRIGWTHQPSVIDEMHACQAALEEIEAAAPRGCKLVWTLGNHDARFETRLAQSSPQYEKVKGFTLKDHFPKWTPCWSCWVSEGLVVKHRYKGGIHATHNNTLTSGTHFVTGHLHSLKVTPYSDYNGTRFGVDTGTLAEVDGPQFIDYLEDNPVNWRSGFAVLTLHKGRLMWPELVHKWDAEQVQFRGQIIDVSEM